MSGKSIFHIDLLSNYQVVDREGVFKVKVAADVTDNNLIVKDDWPRYLVPLRVIQAKDLLKLVTYLKDNGVVPFESVKKYFITGAIFMDDADKDNLPTKGEEVLATFEYKDDKLQCTHIRQLPKNDLDYVNVAAMDVMYNLVKKFSDE